MRKDIPGSKWPKILPPLSKEQEDIGNDFMRYWHEVLPRKYHLVDHFNHTYSVKNSPKEFLRTLEIGAGNGEHLHYENLNREQLLNYYAVDIRQNMLDKIELNFPDISCILGDCQSKLEFNDDYFDRILAIHVLEHLPNLPAAVKEIHRVCNKNSGTLSVVIPCEGGLAYTLARKISAQRIFEKRYKQSYKWLIEREHINIPQEIIEELAPYFKITHSQYFPLRAPLEFCNLCIGLTLKPISLG